MNPKSSFIILIFVLFISCDNDDYPHADVPSVVLNKFWTEFPEASEVEFNQSDLNYEVEFEIDGKEAGVLITTAGKILKEKKEITWNDLPPEVRTALQKDFEVKELKDPEAVQTEEETYYQVEVRRFLFDEEVVLDKAGKTDSTVSYWK